jgi:hypothetical protein
MDVWEELTKRREEALKSAKEVPQAIREAEEALKRLDALLGVEINHVHSMIGVLRRVQGRASRAARAKPPSHGWAALSKSTNELISYEREVVAAHQEMRALTLHALGDLQRTKSSLLPPAAMLRSQRISNSLTKAVDILSQELKINGDPSKKA